MNSEAIIPSTMAHKKDVMTPMLMKMIAATSLRKDGDRNNNKIVIEICRISHHKHVILIVGFFFPSDSQSLRFGNLISKFIDINKQKCMS